MACVSSGCPLPVSYDSQRATRAVVRGQRRPAGRPRLLCASFSSFGLWWCRLPLLSPHLRGASSRDRAICLPPFSAGAADAPPVSLGARDFEISTKAQKRRIKECSQAMSCNGCRVLRKGCSDTCILRPCLQWIEGAEAQGHATVFVAKFFGRAGLMNFISAVPETQRPALFQSLLYEACGRTVNPVFGAIGLLWSGNWHINQAAVETILKGNSLQPIISALKPAQMLQTGMMPLSSGAMFSYHHHDSATVTTRGEWQNIESKLVRRSVKDSDTTPGTHQQQQQPQQQAPQRQQVRQQEQQNERRVEGISEKKREAAWELLAPVPRRIRPSEYAAKFSVAEEDGHLDLDLTLCSHSPSLKQQQQQQQHQHEAHIRVNSPCQSLTSEGSVTSVETGDLKISLVQQYQHSQKQQMV